MAIKTIAVSEQNHKDLVNLKLEAKASSTDEVIHNLIAQNKERKLEEAVEVVRKRAAEKKITLEEVLKDGEKIRKEIYAKWFKGSS